MGKAIIYSNDTDARVVETKTAHIEPHEYVVWRSVMDPLRLYRASGDDVLGTEVFMKDLPDLVKSLILVHNI